MMIYLSFPWRDCCGCLIAVERGNVADLVCNECGALIRTVAMGEVSQALLRLAMEQGICSATCTHRGAVNTFPGFTSIQAFICRECGEGASRLKAELNSSDPRK